MFVTSDNNYANEFDGRQMNCANYNSLGVFERFCPSSFNGFQRNSGQRARVESATHAWANSQTPSAQVKGGRSGGGSSGGGSCSGGTAAAAVMIGFPPALLARPAAVAAAFAALWRRRRRRRRWQHSALPRARKVLERPRGAWVGRASDRVRDLSGAGRATRNYSFERARRAGRGRVHWCSGRKFRCSI